MLCFRVYRLLGHVEGIEAAGFWLLCAWIR